MSESAVLEVSVGDTDASDSSGSLESSQADLDSAPPLLMETKYDIAVQVDAPMKQLSTLETYVTYRVRCACARWPTPQYVRRRYNHFKALRQRLVAAYPLLPVPPLPPLHTARQQLDRYAASFVAVRTHALHAFLDRVAKHPILTHSEDLRLFVTERDEVIEKVLRPDGGSHSLWSLGGVLAGIGGDSRGNSTVRVKEPEFGAAGDYLHSLQHKLTTLSALTIKLFKDTSALGREMLTVKPVTDAWCSHERGALAAVARAVGAGAAGAGAARAAVSATPARALLPQLAAYAGVVREKILERDALHNTYASSNNTSEDAHNRLEQASEALRSELVDWNGKSKAEIRAQLLDMADKQLLLHQQALMSWESALKSCKESTSMQDIFKTVSKTAVINLSPSRSKELGTCTDPLNGAVANGTGSNSSENVHSALHRDKITANNCTTESSKLRSNAVHSDRDSECKNSSYLDSERENSSYLDSERESSSFLDSDPKNAHRSDSELKNSHSSDSEPKNSHHSNSERLRSEDLELRKTVRYNVDSEPSTLEHSSSGSPKSERSGDSERRDSTSDRKTNGEETSDPLSSMVEIDLSKDS